MIFYHFIDHHFKTCCKYDKLINEVNFYHIYQEFLSDWESANAKYFGYRQMAKGIIIWMGEDIHKLPTIQISDQAGGISMVHFVLTDEKEYGDLKVGDEVTLQGNYLVCHPEFGIVMKQSVVIK